MKDTDSKDWRQKYAELVRSFEADERQYRAQLHSLKRLLTRLGLLAHGQSPQVDAELQKLKRLLAQDPLDSTQLDELATLLAQAVHDSEQTAAKALSTPDRTTAADIGAAAEPATATGASTQHADARTSAATATEPPAQNASTTTSSNRNATTFTLLHDTLQQLLDEVARDAQLSTRCTALRNAFDTGTDAGTADWPALLQQVVTLVAERIRRLEATRGELGALIDHLAGSLEHIARIAAGADDELTQQAQRRDDFSTQVQGEVQALTQTLDDAHGSLSELRQQLRSRLDAIGRHLLTFRQREAEALDAARTRNEQMHTRIRELETQAQHLQQSLQQERRSATLDSLTQIPNRMAWDLRIAEELQRWQPGGPPSCIATWDVDHFKVINDSYGHAAGDKVLKYVAECLGKNLRSMDFLARYGGEEFVMVLPGTSIEQAAALADRIRDAVSRIGFHVSGKRHPISISCGVTVLQAGDTADTAFERADQALYRAKAAGRNRVECG